MPLISVLLTAKDSDPRALRRAISSTLLAMPEDAELVVLDDGSRVSLEGALTRITDRRVRFIRKERGVGIGAGRKFLMEQSDSTYVAGMDHDDVTLPGRFRVELHALRSGVDFVFSTIVRVYDGPRIRPGLPLPISAAAMPLHLLIQNPLCAPTMAARRTMVEKAGGYRDIVGEDHDLWLRALAIGAKMVRTARPLLAYRVNSKQTSAQHGYTRQAYDDSRKREAYESFVQADFGVKASWLDALWSDESGTPRMAEDLRPLQSLVAERSTELGRVQRFVLSRTTRLLSARI